jgi:hypothetical protein
VLVYRYYNDGIVYYNLTFCTRKSLMTDLGSTEEVEKFKTGQKVRITEGKFAGVTGIVARYQSQQRVGIVIDGLLTVCTAYVPSAFIEIII